MVFTPATPVPDGHTHGTFMEKFAAHATSTRIMNTAPCWKKTFGDQLDGSTCFELRALDKAVLVRAIIFCEYGAAA